MTMTRSIRLRRIKAGSLFQLVFIAVASVCAPFFLLCGVLAYFGAKTVSFSGEHVTGIKGLLTAALMAPFFIVLLTLFAWFAAYLGIRGWGLLRPIRLEFVPAEPESDSPSE